MARSSGATGGAPKWTSEAIHLCMSVFRLPTHSRYAAWLSCGNGGTDDAEPSTPEKGPVANKKHLELGCGVPVVVSLVRKGGIRPTYYGTFYVFPVRSLNGEGTSTWRQQELLRVAVCGVRV